ncbi:hypothetical protein ACIQ34_01395 [Ureibacillus sp. NPDC094379]
MTYTSFNPIQTQNTVQQNQPLTLKQGQVFHGTIKKLYPDQMAEIQIGSHKLFAKLETPLKAGDSHFFQVSNMNPQTELKVVSGPMSPSISQTQQIQQLLDVMNLPKSPEIQQILSHFVKQQIPISKDQLINAEVWIKNLSNGMTKEEALSALQKMIELKMPYTNEVFKALIMGTKTSGMSASLQTFMQQLANESNIQAQTKSNLMQQLQQITKPLEQEVGGVALARTIQVLTNPSETNANKLQALNLMKEAGVIPKSATVQNWLSHSFGQITSQTNDGTKQSNAGQLIQLISKINAENMSQTLNQVKSWISDQQLLTVSQKVELQEVIARFEKLPRAENSGELFAKQVHEQLMKAFSTNAASGLFATDQVGLSSKEHLASLLQTNHVNSALLLNVAQKGNDSPQPPVQNMMLQVEAQVQDSINRGAMEQVIKSVLKDLGLSYEAALNQKGSNTQTINQTLKPQLLSLLQDPVISQGLRESADHLMARLNGMQLLSGENGHQHQIVMQIPLQFFGKQMDATLQWNGRMKEDGKIDSNYARILFYLDMDSLNETVIDMHVQNRIVTITIFNENEHLNLLAEPLKAALKEGLREKEYQLSGVFLKPMISEQSRSKTNPIQYKNLQQTGVDIRI